MSASLLRAALCAACILPAGGCSLLTDLADGRDGARLLARGGGRPAWSADGRAVYYTDRDGSGVTTIRLQAVHAESGRDRTVTSLTALNAAEQVRTTADPTVVYFSAGNTDWSLQYTIHRVPADGGSAQPLATNAGWAGFVVSAAGNRLAYPGPTHRSDSLQIISLDDGGAASAVAIPSASTRPQVVDISPEGATLVYRASGGVYTVAAAGGAHRLLVPGSDSADPDSAELIGARVVWDGATPHVFVASSRAEGDRRTVSIHDVDGATGVRTLVGTIPGAVTNAWTLTSSRDGRSFAAWVPVAIERANIERTTYRFRLYVQTPTSSGPEPVLDWTADEPLTWLDFSPDGRHLGLALSGRLYVVALDD